MLFVLMASLYSLEILLSNTWCFGSILHDLSLLINFWYTLTILPAVRFLIGSWRMALLSILVSTIMYWFPLVDLVGNFPVWLIYIHCWNSSWRLMTFTKMSLCILVVCVSLFWSSLLLSALSGCMSILKQTLVDLTPDGCFLMWPFCVASDLGKCLLTAGVVRPGHVAKLPLLIAFIHVHLVKNPAAA